MNRQSYLMEQLCTVGVAGAYAAVMTAMYWETATAADGERTLLIILVPWIRHVVLAGSVILFVLVLLRAIGVWRTAGQVGHDYEHDAEHDHVHVHEHHHDHGHAHAHAHDHHGHDHAHGWSPWRYAVLLFPLMLFFLPLDYNEMIQAYEKELMGKGGGDADVKSFGGAGAPLTSFSILAFSQAPIDRAIAPLVSQFGLPGTAGLQAAIDRAEEEADVPGATIELATAEQLGISASQRDQWRSYSRVEVEGMFSPGGGDPRVFQVVRLRMACCIGDARPASVMARMMSQNPERIREYLKVRETSGQWVTVKGRADFIMHEGKWKLVIRAFRVRPTKAPPNPYIS